MSAWLERLGGTRAAALLALVAVLMPLAWTYQGNGVNLPVLFYFALGLIALASIAVAGLLKSERQLLDARPYLIGLGLYLAVCTASLLVSTIPEVSSVHWWLRLALVVGGLTFFYLARMTTAANAARLLLALTCVGCAAWGLIEFADSPRRATGPFMDTNNFALMCVVGVFLVLPELLTEGAPAPRRLLTWVALTLLTFAIFCAYSRAISLIWLVGTLSYCALAWPLASGRQNLIAYVLLGLLCYIIAVLLAPELGTRVTSEGDLANTIGVREAMLNAALNMWRDHPLLGAGIGTFRVLYPGYRLHADQVTAGNSPHNDYLLGLAEAGPLLCALYLFMFIGVAWRGCAAAVRLVRAKAGYGNPQEVALALAAGALLAHAAINFVTITLSLQFMLGCVTGLLFAIPAPRRMAHESAAAAMAEPADAMPVHRQRLLLALVVLGLLLPMRILAQDAMAYAVFLQQEGMPFARTIGGDGRLFLKFAQRLGDLGPARGLPSFGVANYYETLARRSNGEARLQFSAQAAFYYASSLDRMPFNHRAYLAWAGLYVQPWYRNLDKAASLARVAQSIDPTDANVYALMVQIELMRNDQRAAYDILRTGFFPWAYYCATTRADPSERMLRQLRDWAALYGDGPPAAGIEAGLARALRVQEAVQLETMFGWR